MCRIESVEGRVGKRRTMVVILFYLKDFEEEQISRNLSQDFHFSRTFLPFRSLKPHYKPGDLCVISVHRIK